MYPPDPSGRQANEHTRLQYANPSQREADERFVAAQSFQRANVYQPNNQPYRAGTPQYYHGAPQGQAPPNPYRAARQAEPTIITGGGDYTSSE
ncbi:MAG: hypothetical protein Q9218_001455, partial [Villophora microphyllina]